MSLTDLISQVEFLVDTAGNKKAAVVELAVWEELLALLEDQESERRWDELFTNHPEVLERLAAEADIEVAAGRIKELVPEEL